MNKTYIAAVLSLELMLPKPEGEEEAAKERLAEKLKGIFQTLQATLQPHADEDFPYIGIALESAMEVSLVQEESAIKEGEKAN